jgi:hypothetical protein
MKTTREWNVLFSQNDHGCSATFFDVSTKHPQKLNLNSISVPSGTTVTLTFKKGLSFDAHWHACSSAIVTDRGGGSKPNYDLEDDNPNWSRLSKTMAKRKPAIKFRVDGRNTCARLQLKIPACTGPFGVKRGSVRLISVPDPVTILRITVNVS